MTDITKTAITMVLDRSGSMNVCRKATIDAVNKYLAEARSSEQLTDADFELMIFDSQSIDTIRSGPMTNVADIGDADFQPRAMTPLWDACGRGIDSLDKKVGPNAENGKAVLVIVTDGEENHSMKHTASSIRELIEARQNAGWLIIFLGAGLDNAVQAKSVGINVENVANIGLDEAALSATMDAMVETNVAYASTRSFEEAKAYAASPKFSRSMRMAMGYASGGDALRAANPIKTPVVPLVKDTGDAWGGSASSGDAWTK